MLRTVPVERFRSLGQVVVAFCLEPLVTVADPLVEVAPLRHPYVELEHVHVRDILLLPAVELGVEGEAVAQARVGIPQHGDGLRHPALHRWRSPRGIRSSRAWQERRPLGLRPLVAEVYVQDAFQEARIDDAVQGRLPYFT